QDTEFWLSDGNLILVAGDTAFKVYKGLLAMQSTVFSDMLVAANPQASEVFDDHPVVRLSDSPQDLRHLLRILVPAKTLHVSEEQGYNFDQLFALVRLAHKYGIEDVEEQALTHLKLYFTCKFDVWETQKLRFTVEPAHGIGVVQLARLTNNLDMLPVALYTCARLGGSITEGWVREDGTVEHLTSQDLQRCIAGFGALRSDVFPTIFNATDFPPPPERLSNSMCLRELQFLRADEMTRICVASAGGLDTLHEDINRTLDGFAICAACRALFLRRHEIERARIWSRLPDMFGL
ncbi:hypothetical protein C8Q78DRAFT_953454, partial [Trametes maxima]